MAFFLNRVGRFAFRHRWAVLLAWVAVVAGVVVVGFSAPSAPPDDHAIPGTEFSKANTQIQQRFQTNPDGSSAQIVFVAPHGEKVTAKKYTRVIDEVVSAAAKSPQVVGSDTPAESGQVSKDGSTGIADVNYSVGNDDLTDATTGTLQDAAQIGRQAGLTVEIGGSALSPPASETGLLFGVAAAAVVLLITFGALAAAGMPLLTAIAGVGLSLFGIMALSKPLGLSSTTLQLALMLGLAVGIDYALFIVSRYREERGRGLEPLDAAGAAVGTAGSAVVFAGLTVVIALAGLAVVGIPSATKMGLAAAATIVVSVLVALTLVPALLGIWPRAVLPRSMRKAARKAIPGGAPVRPAGTKANLGSRWARFVLRHPVPLLLLGVIGLGALALPATHMRLGEAGNAILSTSTTERRAYDQISHAFGPGYNGQLAMLVTPQAGTNLKTAASQVADQVADTPGVVKVSKPQFDQAGDAAIVTVTPATAPDSPKTATLVGVIRDERPAIQAQTGATYLVTGLTAANIDIAAKVGGALIPYLLTVVGLAFLLLLVVFRSVLVPLKATAGFALSVFAGLGAMVAVFQWGWLGGLLGVPATGPIQPFMPIMLVGISFGLAMDYEVFLVSRIHEAHARGERARDAVVSGFRHSSRVVVAAALIMTSVFAGFLTNSNLVIKEIGVGLAVTVLLDAFVVRMTLVPAVLGLQGKAAWWRPNWLERFLPHLDIEGRALEARLTPAAPQDSRERQPARTGAGTAPTGTADEPDGRGPDPRE
ncbi:MMPL family transporter [Actinomadura nitritigenes]|uniref:MMPL family transporter n=1 Tax=Actinomadura nitritigenes TaxID=134602 RepID=UPI003D914B48